MIRRQRTWLLAFLQAEWILMFPNYIGINPPSGTRAPSRSPPVSWWSEWRTDSSVMMLPGIWTCHMTKEVEPSCFNDTWNWRAAGSLQCTAVIDSVPQVVHVGSSQVEVDNEFTYLGACTTCDSSSESEILRIDIARNCMTLLEKHVWKSHIRVDTNVRLYQTCVLPMLVYGSEVLTITKALARRLHAFDTWSLRKILWIPYTRHITMLSTLLSGRLPAQKGWEKMDFFVRNTTKLHFL